MLIEVGHGPHPGGFEKGAYAHGVHEYDLNWIAARECAQALGEEGVPCQITDSGASLYDIGQEARDFDCFVSIHHNAFNGQAQGCEALVHQDKHEQDDIDLAQFISRRLAYVLGFHDRGVKQMRLGVLSGAEDAEENHYRFTQASVLAECYFMDTVKDGHSTLSKAAGKAIAQGIINFLSTKNG